MSYPVEIRPSVSWDDWEALREHYTAEATTGAIPGALLVGEPSPTFTAGRAECASGYEPCYPGASVRRTNRGGRWTYHGPGQLVVYPIFRLTAFGYASRGVRPFLEDFRACLIRWIRSLGVEAMPGEPFGIYHGRAKLGAFGVSVGRGVISHGAALYLTPQSEPFRSIVPCGVANQAIVSLRELGVLLDWRECASQIVDNVKKSFLPIGDSAYNVTQFEGIEAVKGP